VQPWRGPEGSRKSRLPDFKTVRESGKVVSHTHRPPLPQEVVLIHTFIRGWVDSSAIVRPEGLVKIPMPHSGIEPGTLQFVAQCLDPLRHRVSFNSTKMSSLTFKSCWGLARV
jgi:hypothetical protein